LIGKVVNYRYEVLEKCGDGNFFSVYKARDKVMNRLVAIKVLAPQYSQNGEFADRLITEAQMAGDLTHANIAKVLEADSEDGTYFVAVEYVRGINLKDRIRRTGPFGISYAVDIAIAVAEALDYAHRRGVVHGDVRPHNILTSPEGQVKLTDFGTAKALAAFPAIREATMLRAVHYMAPEVVRGETPQPSSDIYSLGVVLYEMLTGSVPYEGDTSAAVAARQLQDPVPSPQTLNAGVPALLNEIAMKAMQKDPAARFASAAEFVAALARVREWLRTGQTPAWPPRQVVAAPDEEPAYEREERSDNFVRNALISLLGVFVVAIITAVLIVRLLGGAHNGIPVPDLIGKTWEQATQAADKQGIELQEHRQDNDKFPAGQIYLTDPRTGETVPKDKPIVQVWVSNGPKMLVVPDVVGMSDTEARRKVAEAGFVPGGTLSEYSSAVKAGNVMRQSPPSGQRQEPLKPVDIVVSLGPEQPPTLPPNGEVEPPYTGTTTPPSGELRKREFLVDASIPSNARGPQEVRIEVEDAYGLNTPHEDTHRAGETISKTVVAYGEDVEIRVYIGGRVVRDVVYQGDRLVRDDEY